MGDKTQALISILKLQPVVPVLVIKDLAHAVPLARALVAGGLKAIEITRFIAADQLPAKFPSCHARGQLRGSGA